MSQGYPVKSGGSDVIALSDATFYTDLMDGGYEGGQVYLTFGTVSGSTFVPATPGGTGSATASGCPMVIDTATPANNVFIGSDTGAAVDVTTVTTTGIATYTPPKFTGRVEQGAITISGSAGITTATHFKAVFWRY